MRAQSGACAEVQIPDYGTMLWSPGSRNCSRKAGMHSDSRTYFNKRARSQFGACAEVQFPDYGTVLWAPGSRNYSRNHCDFSTLLAKRARALSGASAEVQFREYGTDLWARGNRNLSRKALRFQHLFFQERELSLEHAQRCSILIMEQSCGPLSVEIFPGKHCDFSTYVAMRTTAL
jgi:hypothetical protein